MEEQHAGGAASTLCARGPGEPKYKFSQGAIFHKAGSGLDVKLPSQYESSSNSNIDDHLIESLNAARWA